MWPGLTGRMSMKAAQTSSRWTKLAGSSPARIRQKMQSDAMKTSKQVVLSGNSECGADLPDERQENVAAVGHIHQAQEGRTPMTKEIAAVLRPGESGFLEVYGGVQGPQVLAR